MRGRLGLLVVAMAAGAAASPDEPGLLVARVDRLRAEGDLDTALEHARDGRERFPDAIDLHARYQDLCRSLGQEAQVRAEYRRRWRSNKTVESICLYARLLEGRAAEREYRHALRLEPDHFWAHYGLGTTYLGMGDLAGARHHLELAQTLRPDVAAPKIRLGRLAEREGDLEEALRCYRLAARVAPDVPDPLFHEFFALLALGDRGGAGAVAERLLAHRAPDAASLGHIARGLLYSAGGDPAAAAAEFGASVRVAVRFGGHALVLLGDALADVGRIDEARQAYEEALARNARNVRARLGLGYLLYRQGDLRAADREFAAAEDEAKRTDPRNAAQPCLFRGFLAEEAGRESQALHHVLRALRYDREDATAWLALGALYERMEQASKAQAAYEEAARLDEAGALAPFQAGLVAADLKRGNRSLELLEEAVRRDPGLLDAYLAAGSVCQDLLARPRDAKDWYRRYLDRGGSDPRVHDWLAE